MKKSLEFMIKSRPNSTNFPTGKKDNLDFSKNCKTKRRNYKKNLLKVFRLWKDAKTGSESIFLGSKTLRITINKKRNKKRLIPSVMINFTIEPWKISI
jgi:hypothetical protein